MKKIFLFLGIGVCLYTQATAQELTPGAELGINFTNLKTRVNGVNGTSQSMAGLKIGGILDIGIAPNLSIQPGLFFTQKGSRQDYIMSVQNEAGVITTNETKDEYRVNYLEIPVNFQYKFSYHKYGQFFIGAGPYFAVVLSGKLTTDDITTVDRPNGVITSTDRTTEYSLRIGNNAAKDDIKSGDVGLNFNLGYEFGSGLLLRSNLGLGLMNIMPGGDADNYMRNNSFALSIGYLFR